MSYNKFKRPYIFYDQPRIDDPTRQLSSAIYYQMIGYWPRQWDEIYAIAWHNSMQKYWLLSN
jgi:hypothetical protein